MKFGAVVLDEAFGAILAHAVETGSGRLKKGKVIDNEDIARLKSAGISSLIVARLEKDDVPENEAAERIATALISSNIIADPPFAGRVNLIAKHAGLFEANGRLVNQVNEIDPGITLATLPQFTPVEAGRMVATVKIIPFAVGENQVAGASSIAQNQSMFKIHPWQPRKVGLIATSLPSLKPSTMDKTRQVLEARLAPSKSKIVQEVRIAHDADAVAAAIKDLENKCDLLILFGASATIDNEDVMPSGLQLAGGVVEHFGMPVDPGNLLMLGHFGKVPVIGAPGCARSPSENGFDWILQRVLAGVTVTSNDIAGLGVGGLLKEIHSRPQPRQVAEFGSNIYAIVLAAGQSRRMGKANKLLATINGVPLVRQVVKTALASAIMRVIVVVGHEAAHIENALDGLSVEFVHNPNFTSGLASSLRSGIASLPADCSGALILLGDMPHISCPMLGEILETFEHAPQAAIVQATSSGKRGNPVLWSSLHFDALKQISGDVGARHLIGQNSEHVIEVELGEAASIDIDTPDALRAQGGEIAGE